MQLDMTAVNLHSSSGFSSGDFSEQGRAIAFLEGSVGFNGIYDRH